MAYTYAPRASRYNGAPQGNQLPAYPHLHAAGRWPTLLHDWCSLLCLRGLGPHVPTGAVGIVVTGVSGWFTGPTRETIRGVEQSSFFIFFMVVGGGCCPFLIVVIRCCTFSEFRVVILQVTRDIIASEYFLKVAGCCHFVIWMADEYYPGSWYRWYWSK